MMKHILLIVFSLFSVSLLFLSCDDETNSLVGTWDYTEVAISNCTVSSTNETFDYTGNGYCEMLNDLTRCTKFTLVMTEEEYTINRIVTVDGTQTTFIGETGTYKQVNTIGSNIQFCTDILCRPENYSISNGRLTLESTDSNTNCTTRITATKR